MEKGVGFGVVVVGELELETCWSVDQVARMKEKSYLIRSYQSHLVVLALSKQFYVGWNLMMRDDLLLEPAKHGNL